MSLSVGTSIGHYEITGHLGAGGMGEVYRARDSRLGREVAIKVLPATLATDADRLARFAREARILASLNHPHIAAIYGIEDAGPIRALVLELVEGDTLADRIRRGPLTIAEALPVARQIAEALDAAHQQGIVHRDLKPANIKLRADGSVKVLDFGLAKEMRESPALISEAQTVAPDVTRPGMILGTVAYMSPEQARGLDVDKRSDIWAFGCVLFEMLTGRAPFAGPTQSDIMAGILEREPQWTSLPSYTPASVVRLLHRCLEKNVNKRLRDIGDATALENGALEAVLPEPPHKVIPQRSRTPERLVWAAVVAGLGIAALAGWVRSAEPDSNVPAEVRLDLSTPPTSEPQALAISADGRQVVFAATSEGRSVLWVRDLGGGAARVLEGTAAALYPFWSLDGRSVGFFADGKLKRIDVAGGNPLTLADAPDPRGGAWGPDGQVFFTPTQISPVMRVAATGGSASPVSRLEAGQIGHLYPQVLPGGTHLFYVADGGAAVRGTYVSRLDGADARRLIDGYAAYGPSGHVLFVRETTLFGQAFDQATLALTGMPFLVADGLDLGVGNVSAGTARPAFSASVAGPIVYRSGTLGRSRQATWFDRAGNVTGRVAPAGVSPTGASQQPALSPDEQTIAFVRPDNQQSSDIWLFDVARSAFTRFTLGGGTAPIWSPDGGRMVFTSRRNGNLDLFEKSLAGGEERPLLVDAINASPSDISPDGTRLLFLQASQATLVDIMVMPLSPPGTPVPVVQSPIEELEGQFDPSGRWMAYQSTESGRFEVYVRPVGSAVGRQQVSTQGGTQPRWRRDGKELYYLALDRRLMATTIAISPDGSRVDLGTPTPLFGTTVGGPGLGQREYSVSRDGQRFLIDVPQAQEAAIPITVILNWRPEGGT
ncbi:MAG: protein kinase [Vicinamibacterales bacterium]